MYVIVPKLHAVLCTLCPGSLQRSRAARRPVKASYAICVHALLLAGPPSPPSVPVLRSHPPFHSSNTATRAKYTNTDLAARSSLLALLHCHPSILPIYHDHTYEFERATVHIPHSFTTRNSLLSTTHSSHPLSLSPTHAASSSVKSTPTPPPPRPRRRSSRSPPRSGTGTAAPAP